MNYSQNGSVKRQCSRRSHLAGGGIVAVRRADPDGRLCDALAEEQVRVKPEEVQLELRHVRGQPLPDEAWASANLGHFL